MVESPSQNQMRTTPRMLKKSRDPTTEFYSAQAGRARVGTSGMQVPTVVVRPRQITTAVTTEAIWNQFIRRGHYQLMEALKKEEIDHHVRFTERSNKMFFFQSFFTLNLHEMGIYTRENQAIIDEIKHCLTHGSV